MEGGIPLPPVGGFLSYRPSTGTTCQPIYGNSGRGRAEIPNLRIWAVPGCALVGKTYASFVITMWTTARKKPDTPLAVDDVPPERGGLESTLELVPLAVQPPSSTAPQGLRTTKSLADFYLPSREYRIR